MRLSSVDGDHGCDEERFARGVREVGEVGVHDEHDGRQCGAEEERARLPPSTQGTFIMIRRLYHFKNTASMKLNQLRVHLANKQLAAYIIPHDDAHLVSQPPLTQIRASTPPPQMTESNSSRAFPGLPASPLSLPLAPSSGLTLAIISR